MVKQELTHILNDRNSTHGNFITNSAISCSLKKVLSDFGYEYLDDYKRECLDMICHKIGRIIAGDPNYIDSWRDIAGYANLVVKLLEDTPGATDAVVTKIKIKGEDDI